jgi:diguanylate cyclase (GGDEF)-like protein
LGIHLLQIEHLVLFVLFTLLAVSNSRMQKRLGGVDWFSLYNVCLIFAASAVVFRGSLPRGVSIVGADLFFAISYFLLYLCVAKLFGNKKYFFYLEASLVLIALIPLLEFGVIHPETKLRLIVLSLVLGCQQGLIALFLLRLENRQFRIAASPLAMMLAGLFLSNAVRIAGILYIGAPSDYLQAGGFLEGILIANSCLQCGAVVAYVWMTATLLRNELEVQALTDPLTGLLNRRAMEAQAEKALATCRGSKLSVSVVILDLDGFKEINDSLGHLYGDAMLIQVANCLRLGVRKDDLLGRFGGDEFVVLLPGTGTREATEMAERLRVSLATLQPVHQRTTSSITASFGVAHGSGAAVNWDELMAKCDQALYAVKKDGGNGVRVEA